MSQVEMVMGSKEYLYGDIRTDKVLETQAVSMSISPTPEPGEWVSADWVGRPGKFRSARIFVNGNLPRGLYYVFARVTDSPEAPIIALGTLRIK